MSRTSSDQSFFFSALPNSEMASGPGNISGNSVSTVADQVIAYSIMPTATRGASDNRNSERTSARRSISRSLFHIAALAGLDFFGHRDGDAILIDLDHRHSLTVERQQDTLTISTSALDPIPAAKLLHRLHVADLAPF